MSESFIDMAMGDAPEEGIVEEGRYDLRIVGKDVKETKKGNRKLLQCTISVEGIPDVAPIMQFLTFPNEADWRNEPDMAKNFIRRVKRFCSLFNVTWQADGFDPSQLDGATAEDVLVSIEKGDDDIERNVIKPPRIDAGM